MDRYIDKWTRHTKLVVFQVLYEQLVRVTFATRVRGTKQLGDGQGKDQKTASQKVLGQGGGLKQREERGNRTQGWPHGERDEKLEAEIQRAWGEGGENERETWNDEQSKKGPEQWMKRKIRGCRAKEKRTRKNASNSIHVYASQYIEKSKFSLPGMRTRTSLNSNRTPEIFFPKSTIFYSEILPFPRFSSSHPLSYSTLALHLVPVFSINEKINFNSSLWLLWLF